MSDRSARARRRSAALDARVVRVLYFGTYDRAYPRNAQVDLGAPGAGVEVASSIAPVWERRHNWSVGVRQLLAQRRGRAEPRLAVAGRESTSDASIVGYPGHFDLPAAKRVAAGGPLVFNPLVSLHDTLVSDRGRFRRGASPAPGSSSSSTAVPFAGADLVVADTQAHAGVLSRRVRPAAGPASRSASSAPRTGSSAPAGSRSAPFHALFVGKLIPLHGLETILAAAALAPEVPFRIVGSGQLEPSSRTGPRTSSGSPGSSTRTCRTSSRRAGCALGIFGTGDKARRVIPNKAFQALACGTPLVTADTPAARELLTDAATRSSCRRAIRVRSPAAVRRLAADPALRGERSAQPGGATYEARASEAAPRRRAGGRCSSARSQAR